MLGRWDGWGGSVEGPGSLLSRTFHKDSSFSVLYVASEVDLQVETYSLMNLCSTLIVFYNLCTGCMQ